MVLVATQVKRRRGTTAENDAFTGAEGEITVDIEKHELRIHDGVTQGGFVIGQGDGSGSGRNIGDIFYTTRTDTALAGAVECNGGTYNTEDYEGDGSIGELLEAGKLPYVSLSQYATLLSTNGVVGVFGWNGTGTTSFRVPTLKDVFVECGQASELGDYVSAGLPNITGSFNTISYNSSTSGAFSQTSSFSSEGWDGSSNGGKTYAFNASSSSAIYGNSATVQPEAVKYRAMIQLFNATTDEAVATVGTIVAQVGELNSHRVVDFQIPTAENGYTWYRKYADGWVEQGGRWTGSQACGQGQETNVTVNLPITMSDTRYYANASVTNTYLFQMRYQPATMNVKFGFGAYSVARTITEFVWTVAGMTK